MTIINKLREIKIAIQQWEAGEWDSTVTIAEIEDILKEGEK